MGSVSPTLQGRGGSRELLGSSRAPFPVAGDPTEGPQGVVGASFPSPWHSGSHTGSVPGPRRCRVGFSLNIFVWKTSSLPWVQPEGGWGGAALGKAILGGKSQFPQCGAGPDARGAGLHPCWVEGTAAGLGMSPVATPRCHTLSSTIHPTREGPGRIQPRELLIHPTKGLETPSQTPSCGRWEWREGEAINKSNFYGWLRSL